MELGMRKSIVATVITLGVLASAGAHAQNSWSTRSELGFVASRGNTSTETANAKIQVIREVKRWKYTLETTGLYGKSQGIATAQHVDARLQVAKSFGKDERWFWFGAGRYEDDRFSGFDYQATVSAGLGRHFIATDRTKLIGTLGVGYKFFETRDTFDPVSGLLLQQGESDNEAVLRGTVDYTHTLTATAQLFDKFLVESGANNSSLQNDIGIQVKISDVLALAAAYTVHYNSDPPLNFGKTDSLTTLNLVYELK
jgi:putative salt-induced outer membrane protein